MTWGTVQPSATKACSAVTCAQIRRVDGVEVGLSALAAGVHLAHACLEFFLKRGEAEALYHVTNSYAGDRRLGPVVVGIRPVGARDRDIFSYI